MKLTTLYHVMVILLQILSVALFSKGFFNVREFLPDVNIIMDENDQKEPTKIVMVLFDALRVDFATNSNFNFPQRMLKDNPDRTLFYLAISDTPTVTMSRLQAFSTGNFPSFINLKANFFAQQMEEDNIIWQLNRVNKSAVFMGDDTWTKLYPTEFKRSYPYDSFEVSDLHSVDNGVIQNAFPNLQKEDWNLLICHFLGLDHVGHTYDAQSPKITSKLIQYSNFLDDIYEKMDNSTILIVFGDHGMTQDGNHGGNSEEETNTAFFATYKGEKVFFKDFKDGLKSIDMKYNQNEQVQSFLNDSYHFESHLVDRVHFMRKISQIDVVPTIANILDISIPYSNLGMYLPEFTLKNNDEPYNQTIQRNFKRVMTTLDQVIQYIEKVQIKSLKFAPQQLDGWLSNYKYLKMLPKAKISFFIDLLQDCENIIEASALINEIQIMSRQLWNEFDYTLMKLAMFMFVQMLALSFQFTRFLYHANEIQQNEYIHRIKSRDNQNSISILDESYTFSDLVRITQANHKEAVCGVTIFLFLHAIHDMKLVYIVCFLTIFLSAYLCYDLQIKLNEQQEFLKKTYNLINGNKLDEIDKKEVQKQKFRIFQQIWSFIFFVKLKFGHSWILLSLTCLRSEDESLFQVFLNNVTLFCLVDIISMLIQQEKTKTTFNQLYYLLVSILSLTFAEQYDTNTLRAYKISYLKSKQFAWFFQSIITSTILPSILLQFQLSWMFNSRKIAQERHLFILKSLVHFNLLIVSIFHMLVFANIDTQADFYNIYIPRIIYLLFSIGIGLTLVLIKNTKREFISIQCMKQLLIKVLIPLLLLTGSQSLAVFASFFITVYALFKLLEHYNLVKKYKIFKNNGSYFFFGCLAILTNYYWFMLGNRCQLAAIKFERGYLGFRKYNFYLMASLVALYQLNFHFVGVLLLPIISDVIIYLSFNKKLVKEEIIGGSLMKANLVSRRFHMMLFQNHFMVQMMITAINCYYNLHDLLLTNDFAPKYLFDAFIFVSVSLLSLFV